MSLSYSRNAWRLRTIWAGLLLVIVLAVMPGEGQAQAPATHTLTQSDNGTTLTVPAGDTVELRLPTTFNWDVSITNLGVLTRPPVALARGVQGLWTASSPGESVINATGSPQCNPGQPCPAIAAVFSATIDVAAADTTCPTVNRAAGWNLVVSPDHAPRL